jgi:hypothetical protein
MKTPRLDRSSAELSLLDPENEEKTGCRNRVGNGLYSVSLRTRRFELRFARNTAPGKVL